MNKKILCIIIFIVTILMRTSVNAEDLTTEMIQDQKGNFGISDFIKTLANDYGYNERHNNTHFVSFTVGYDIFKY